LLTHQSFLAKATFPGFSANEFAGNLLIPDNFLNQIDTEQLLRLQAQEYDSFLADYRKLWCVSNRAKRKAYQKHSQALYAGMFLV
jgi:Zn-dependent peptidase ImmA (M78 family)